MRVAVVGGGVQGCAVALELALRGMDVALYERRLLLYDGASRHSEGKIHLGFVYAADRTLRSARMMARGAAEFAPSLRRWIGDRVEALMVSSPFTYAVHRTSMHSAGELEAIYIRIGAIVDEIVPPGSYFGEERPGRVRRVESDEFGEDVAALFETAEIALDPDVLADELVAAVEAHPRIAVATATTVISVDRRCRRLRISDAEGERESPRFDHIVNCAWEGRLAIDATAGIAPPAPWSYRMKYFARLELPGGRCRLPSTTVVLGAFGDIVDFGRGGTFFSWYPVGRRGWSSDVAPPAWPTRPDDDDARRISAGIGAGLARVVPAAGRLLADHGDRAHVRGGVIYALGETDIDDAGSELHTRFRVGPWSHATYHTVDTGKLTLAPLFALHVANRIEAGGRP